MTILNTSALLVPPEVVTVTLRAPITAEAEITNDAVSEVPLSNVTVTEPTVTPTPFTATVVLPETKFVPVIVTTTVVPTVPELG